MTIGILPILGLAGGGYLVAKAIMKPKAIQGIASVTESGIPVRVFTPVASSVTTEQRTGIAQTAPLPAKRPKVTPTPAIHKLPAPKKGAPPSPPPANVGIVYAPPKAVIPDQPLPIVMTPTGSSPIGLGSVKDVQNALNTLGYQPLLKADGVLGPKTVANIKAFQSKAGLVVDGNAGPATKAALAAAVAALAVSGAVQVAVKAESAPLPQAKNMTLRDIQAILNKLGATPSLKVDGVSGPKTVAAIKNFQVRHGLAPDGIAGEKTKTALLLASGNAT